MSKYSLTIADTKDLEIIFKHRVEVSYWRGKMNSEQYLERTRRLFRHPFGRQRISTFILRDERDEVCASLDILNVTFLLNDQGELREQKVPLITSLVTPAAKRGRGYASLILHEYEIRNPSSIFFLYSDIGAQFYERLGYAPFPMAELQEQVREAESFLFDAQPIKLDQLIDAAKNACRAWVAETIGAAICLPDAQFLDWHLERYRAFAAFTGQTFPPELFWSLRHRDTADNSVLHHVVAGAPDFIAAQFDCLWLTPGCAQCVQFAHSLARASGVQTIRYWAATPDSATVDDECVPMLKMSSSCHGTRLLAPQISTWF